MAAKKRVRVALEQRRQEAARQLLAMFAPEDFPTADEERELLALWAAPRFPAPKMHPRRRST